MFLYFFSYVEEVDGVFPKKIRNLIKTIFLLRIKNINQFSKLPKEIICEICGYLPKLCSKAFIKDFKID